MCKNPRDSDTKRNISIFDHEHKKDMLHEKHKGKLLHRVHHVHPAYVFFGSCIMQHEVLQEKHLVFCDNCDCEPV